MPSLPEWRRAHDHRRRSRRSYRTDPGGVEGDPDTIANVAPVEPILRQRVPAAPGPVEPRGEITYTAEFINTHTSQEAIFKYELWANGELVEQSVDLNVEPSTGRVEWSLSFRVEQVNDVTIDAFPVEARITALDGSSKSFGRATYEVGEEQRVSDDRVTVACQGVDSTAGLASVSVSNNNQQPVRVRLTATAEEVVIGQQVVEIPGESERPTDVPLEKAALANRLAPGETARYNVSLAVASVEETAIGVD